MQVLLGSISRRLVLQILGNARLLRSLWIFLIWSLHLMKSHFSCTCCQTFWLMQLLRTSIKAECGWETMNICVKLMEKIPFFWRLQKWMNRPLKQRFAGRPLQRPMSPQPCRLVSLPAAWRVGVPSDAWAEKDGHGRRLPDGAELLSKSFQPQQTADPTPVVLLLPASSFWWSSVV